MKINFDEVTQDADKAAALITDRVKEDDAEGAAENRDFYDGRHFGPNGEYWTGPQPKDAGSPAALNLVRKEFASKNAVKESVKSHRDGVISREPEWTFVPRRALAKKGDVVDGVALTADEVPNPDEAARIRELNAALTTWWNERSVLETLQEAVTHLLTTRRAVLRIYFPPAYLVGGQLPQYRTLEEALSKIYLLAHPYSEAGVFTDEASMQRIGVFATDEDGARKVELTYLNPAGQTVLRTVRKDKAGARTPHTPPSNRTQSIFSSEPADTPEAQEAAPMPLGGNLLMHELSARECFVSEQMRQSNKSLNKAKTLRGHVLNEAGFPETNFLNIALPGKLEPDATRPGGQRFVPDPIERGASVVNSWVGIEWTDQAGQKHLATPSIHNRDIPSLSAFVESERADYQDVLEESGQVHKLMAADATAAALSRIQAKGAFGTSLLPTVGKVNAAVRWIGETVTAFAALLTGEPERYRDLRMNADCRVDLGPVLPDEIRVAEELVEKKVWSRARLQRLTGIEDTDAEDAAILADEEKLNPMGKVQAERARLNLERDRAAGSEESAVARRIEEGAKEVGGIQ